LQAGTDTLGSAFEILDEDIIANIYDDYNDWSTFNEIEVLM